jgi:hypothetical protein
MGKYYSFLQLSKISQIKASYDYGIGWKETHPDEDLSFFEIYDILMQDTNEVYNADGDIIEN